MPNRIPMLGILLRGLEPPKGRDVQEQRDHERGFGVAPKAELLPHTSGEPAWNLPWLHGHAVG